MSEYSADVAVVQRSESIACGIAIFSKHLADELRARDWRVEEYYVRYQAYRPHQITLINYVPSMWAGTSNEFEILMTKASQGRVIVLLHGVYPRTTRQHRSETPCPEMPAHMNSIWRRADLVLALSRSCAETFRTWAPLEKPRARVMTIRHPGAYDAANFNLSKAPREYIFIGGILRRKKNPASKPTQQLLAGLAESGFKVWLHVTNRNSFANRVNVWRVTSGFLSDTQWVAALRGARMVGCPYETSIQTVSGLAIESLSVGTPVIATRSPFASELQELAPSMVIVEDALEKWPALISALSSSPRTRDLGVSTWDEFTHVVEEALRSTHTAN